MVLVVNINKINAYVKISGLNMEDKTDKNWISLVKKVFVVVGQVLFTILNMILGEAKSAVHVTRKSITFLDVSWMVIGYIRIRIRVKKSRSKVQ